MKKIISLFLLLSIIFTLCACGNNNVQTNNNQTDNTNTSESNAQNSDPTQPTQSTSVIPNTKLIDKEESVYYKNNTWNNGVEAKDIKAKECAKTGDKWPTLETGDLFVCGEFMYGYNMRFDGTKWIEDTTMNGWGVRIANHETISKASAYMILNSVNNKPVVSAAYLMSGMRLSYYARTLVIPKNITDITGMLKDARLSSDIRLNILGIPEKFDLAFDVMPDIKKKVNDAVYYACSKTIKLNFGGNYEQTMEIATNAKYENIIPIIVGSEEM